MPEQIPAQIVKVTLRSQPLVEWAEVSTRGQDVKIYPDFEKISDRNAVHVVFAAVRLFVVTIHGPHGEIVSEIASVAENIVRS